MHYFIDRTSMNILKSFINKKECFAHIVHRLAYFTLLCLFFYSCEQDSPIDTREPEKEKEELPEKEPEKKLEEGDQPGDPEKNPENHSRPSYTLQELEAKTYELEVICHVLASSSSELNEKITSERLREILNGINNLYAGGGGGADVHVRFVLAKNDPQGQPLDEEGIVRASITSNYLPYLTVRSDQKGGVYHSQSWDFKRYINVYIFRFQETETYGVSTFPDMPSEHSLPGLQHYHSSNLDQHNPCVMLNEIIFGAWKKGSEKAPLNSRAIYVMGHELGHYLGLYHPFKSGPYHHDFCNDTKEYDRAAYEVQHKKLLEEEIMDIYEKGLSSDEVVKKRYMRTPLDGSAPFLSTNIMDYYDTYGHSLTPDQVKRIRECLYYSPTLPGPKITSESETRGIAPIMPYKVECVVCRH